VRSYLITTSEGCLDCINGYSVTRWSKRCLSGIPMEYVEAYRSRAGFVHPRDKKYSGPTQWRLHLRSLQACDYVIGMQCHWNALKCLSVTRLNTVWRYRRSSLGQTRYRETKWIRLDIYGSIMILMECTGVNMAFQIPLLIIDQRGVSIMYGVLPTRRVTHLRVYDA
jgi:hypothetical protein